MSVFVETQKPYNKHTEVLDLLVLLRGCAYEHKNSDKFSFTQFPSKRRNRMNCVFKIACTVFFIPFWPGIDENQKLHIYYLTCLIIGRIFLRLGFGSVNFRPCLSLTTHPCLVPGTVTLYYKFIISGPALSCFATMPD